MNDYSYISIDECQLSALIADTIASDPTYTKAEVYGMMCLLMRLRDVKNKQPASSEDTTSMRVHIADMHAEEADIRGRYIDELNVAKRDTELHAAIIHHLQNGPLPTREIADLLEIPRSNARRRQVIGALLTWMRSRNMIGIADSKYMRNRLWCLPVTE